MALFVRLHAGDFGNDLRLVGRRNDSAATGVTCDLESDSNLTSAASPYHPSGSPVPPTPPPPRAEHSKSVSNSSSAIGLP